MKNYLESKNRFPLSEKSPSEYPISNSEESMCVAIASELGEKSMRFILARRHQLGMAVITSAYATVKDTLRAGKCKNPAGLFNFLLKQELKKREEEKLLPGML